MARSLLPRRVLAAAVGLLLAGPAAASAPAQTARTIAFPPGANVVNVVEDLGVDNTGRTDVTDQLNQMYSDFGRHLQVVYFPKGTYRVSGRSPSTSG